MILPTRQSYPLIPDHRSKHVMMKSLHPTGEEIVKEIKLNKSEIEDSASEADEEEHINDVIPNISDATVLIYVNAKFLSTETVCEKVLE